MNENPLPFLFGKTWKYSAGNRKDIVRYWIMFIFANSISLVCHPLALAWTIDTIQKRGVTPKSAPLLYLQMAVLIAIDLLFWGFHGPARIKECLNAFRAKADYRKALVSGVMGLDLEWHAEHHSGDTIDKVEKGSQALMGFSESSFLPISSLVQLVVCIVMLSCVGALYGAITLAMLSIVAWIVMRFDRDLIPMYRDLNRAENRISESVYDSIGNITTIVILRAERLVFQAISKRIDEPYGLFKRTAILNEIKWSLVSLVGTITTSSIMGIYFYRTAMSGLTVEIGTVYLLMRYLDRIRDLGFQFCSMYNELVIWKTKIQNAEVLSKEFREKSLDDRVLPADWQEISVSGLDFSYDGDDGTKRHLSDISFTIRRGERIAFVGESGSGKSTCLKVTRNLYPQAKPTLTVDGRLVPEGFVEISRSIALVPQDPEIFASTIRDNITLGADYPDEAIAEFAEVARFGDVIEKLPKGLDSAINEKGVNLSGGEKQRLALARGLLACRDKQIILLDEPTSNVDVSNERMIYDRILDRFKDAAIISSVHKLHLLPLFHRIYMFEKGRIVGEGSLDELIRSCPAFQAFWQKCQAQAERQERQEALVGI
ncbi:MAG: ABC transporter ATP-binding protein [Patescibacteria group bacterium]|nr:ABC transporter ATP-binding protein/permease [Patescibacteria group bacterium]MDE1940724.1 ABC transporter ATP-binding protein [Patescibacteria group bacterium]MDE1966678.1 ABC transporter ATP-binding protein [Patescibacteria group bacterium]